MRKRTIVSITMTESMKTVLDGLCAMQNMNRSQFIRELVAKELERVGLMNKDKEEPDGHVCELQTDHDG